MPDEQRLEEQILSQEAEKRVLEKLDQVEKIDIEVKTDFLKIAQGQADGVSVTGQGLVIQEDIRVQEITLQTDSIAINPISAIFGQIELNQPVNAKARILMTEADINCALSSEFIRNQTPSYELNVDGEIVNLHLQKIQVFLPDNHKMEFHGNLLLQEKEKTRPLSFTAKVCPRTHSQPLWLQSFNCAEGEGVSIEFIVALMQKVKELINIPYFEWDNMKVRIENLEIEKGHLILLVEAHVQQIPT